MLPDGLLVVISGRINVGKSIITRNPEYWRYGNLSTVIGPMLRNAADSYRWGSTVSSTIRAWGRRLSFSTLAKIGWECDMPSHETDAAPGDQSIATPLEAPQET